MATQSSLDRDLGRIEGKIDVALQNYGAQLRNHEARLGALEKASDERHGAVKAARWLWGFLTTALGVAGGYAGSHIH
jgi:hypothetical protein